MIGTILIIIGALLIIGGIIAIGWTLNDHQDQIDDLDAEIAAMKRNHYKL